MSSFDAPRKILELIDLKRSFPGTPPVEALKGINLSVNEGEYLSIVGPSGSGKSTLLHILGLLDRPTDGQYILGGNPTEKTTESQRSKIRGRSIGFVFQAFHLIPNRTVLDNVLLATIYSGVPREERQTRAQKAIERVHLEHRINFTPATLSGGEKQRVAIARSVVANPQILLADEPTGNLDSKNSHAIMRLFDELHQDGLTLIVITHDNAVAEHAERRIRISDGNLTELS